MRITNGHNRLHAPSTFSLRITFQQLIRPANGKEFSVLADYRASRDGAESAKLPSPLGTPCQSDQF